MLPTRKYNNFLYNQMRGQGVDFDAGGVKVALVDYSYAPDPVNHAFFDSITGEVVGTNYTAGGQALTNITVTLSSDNVDVILNANDCVWAYSDTGFSNARYAIIYRSSGVATTSVLIGYVDLVDISGNNAADFVISWDPAGIMKWSGETGSTPLPPPPDVHTVVWWENQYSLAQDLSFFGPYSTANDSNSYYTLGLSIDGNMAMYRATGNTVYLDRCLLYVNRMINDAVARAGGYLGWLSSVDGNTEQPLREFYCWRYVCQMLRYMRGLTGTYATQYTSILDFTEKNIWNKWYTRGTTNLYRSVVHICAHSALVANFLRDYAVSATIRTQAATVQDNIDHNGMSSWNGSSIRSAMQVHPNNASAYYWHMYWPKINPTTVAPGIPVEDTNWGSDAAHGGGTLAYITAMRDLNYGTWSDADMQKFVVLWNSIVWPSATVHYNYIIGAGPATPTPPAPTEAGNYNDGAVKLGKYNVALQKRFELYSVADNAQLRGNGALNAKILLGG